MSRQNDIEHLTAEINQLAAQRQQIAQEYQTHHTEVQEQIIDLLKEVGVYDKVLELETGRDQVRQRAQAQADQLSAQIRARQQTLGFLKAREEEDGRKLAHEETAERVLAEAEEGEVVSEMKLLTGKEDAMVEEAKKAAPKKNRSSRKKATKDPAPAP